MITSLLLLAVVSISGKAKVDDALLHGLPEVEAVLTAHGTSQKCTGPSLISVLDRLGYPTGKNLRGPALATGFVVRGRDGYAVLFSLGELDGELGATSAIVATSCDGKAIPETEGPFRLVVPDEVRASRSVRQVDSIEPVLSLSPNEASERRSH